MILILGLAWSIAGLIAGGLLMIAAVTVNLELAFLFIALVAIPLNIFCFGYFVRRLKEKINA